MSNTVRAKGGAARDESGQSAVPGARIWRNPIAATEQMESSSFVFADRTTYKAMLSRFGSEFESGELKAVPIYVGHMRGRTIMADTIGIKEPCFLIYIMEKQGEVVEGLKRMRANVPGLGLAGKGSDGAYTAAFEKFLRKNNLE